MSNKTQIPDEVFDQAADWLLILNSGDMTVEQTALYEQWKTQKIEHALAIQYLDKFSIGTGAIARSGHSKKQLAAEQKTKFKFKFSSLCGLGILAVLGISLYIMPWEKWRADHYSKVGEIKTLHLEDGSKLILASDSAVDIQFSNQARQLRLITGEIFIKTANDPDLQRPFIVATEYGTVQALGTEFTVRDEDHHKIQVNVYREAVAVTRHEHNQTTLIPQGYRAFYDHEKTSQTIKLRNPQPYWTQQILAVENWPLKKVIFELYRYKHGSYRIDPQVQDILVSGLFPLNNINQSLETLADQNQLQLTFYSPFFLSIKNQQPPQTTKPQS
ncbi:FecR family protein [Acinetobacter calcoaceticus]|uniref:FecR family protein n=1 Tax=Acinetobacter calcoaceticus TaxID=471 RepID=A0A4R1XQQ9_ACICA|nr:FecR family protein [Acinetobacter calcoaceticus]